jgi:hypothetical protein
MEELDGAHNPLREFVALGNCLIVRGIKWPYPQGGAGYLLSRSACARLAPMAETIEAHGFYNEDSTFGGVLHDLHVTNMTSDRFLGYTLVRWHRRAVFRSWHMLPRCPPAPVPGEGCRPFISSVSRVVFFHQHAPFDEYYCNLARRLFGAPQNVMWYMVGLQPMLCKAHQSKVGAHL